jgi:hypothetical protein
MYLPMHVLKILSGKAPPPHAHIARKKIKSVVRIKV